MIFFKEDGKDRWTGPAKVTGTEGSKVRIIHAGYDRTVPSCRVIPYKEETYEVNTELDDENAGNVNNDTIRDLSVIDIEQSNREVRPKLNTEIKFKTNDANGWKQGKATKVGKKTGKDKFRVWSRN